nr:hypothetical protein TetV2_00414 [Oceanusvirus sp.]
MGARRGYLPLAASSVGVSDGVAAGSPSLKQRAKHVVEVFLCAALCLFPLVSVGMTLLAFFGPEHAQSSVFKAYSVYVFAVVFSVAAWYAWVLRNVKDYNAAIGGLLDDISSAKASSECKAPPPA